MFEDMLKKFDREDLDKLWSLVKETCNTTEVIDEKAKELWVELKRLYEPDSRDPLWALQRVSVPTADVYIAKKLATVKDFALLHEDKIYSKSKILLRASLLSWCLGRSVVLAEYGGQLMMAL
uniref:Uncharacterized protein n=1 Tax=Tanacetum cinerariifolium TaxID=118510 RepID=A0A6L2NGD3_TANCI|nr:hypothetical protein [Tanacetum cinerariifolium]